MAVGDEYFYGPGRSYIETDGGPNVWTYCAQCGAPAACSLNIMVSQIRCGRCLAEKHQLLPGQGMQLAQDQWRKAKTPRG